MRRLVALILILAFSAPFGALAQQGGEAPVPQPRSIVEALRGAAPAGAAADPQGEAGVESETPATEAIESLTSVPQDVSLAAKVTEDGEPISGGLVWRIFGTTPDDAGQLPMIAKSEDARVALQLPPGEYVVHVAYGLAQVSNTLQVNPGENNKTIILEAGALRLNAAVTGEIPIPINLLSFDVYAGGQGGSDRVLVAEKLAAHEVVTLNAGTYHVVSNFGAINAVERADLRVEPGQLTEATLYHKAAQVAFKLVSEAGGEAIADIEWTVKTAQGETIFSDIGTFPATVLAAGDYVVLAKRGDTVFNRDFEVVPGQPREIEVLTAVY